MSALQQLPPGRVDWGSATRLPPPQEIDWEAENRRQLELSRQPIPGPEPVGPSAVDTAPEAQPQFAPDPLVAAADGVFVSPLDANGEPPMPDADPPLPPVQMAPAVGGGGAPAPAASAAPAAAPTVQSVTLQSLPAGMPDFWEQGRWRDPTMGEAAGETLDAVTRAFNRGSLMDDLAGELEAERPNAERVTAIQREIQKNAPSAEFKLAMDDRATPQQSWQAFKTAPARVTAELTVEALTSFAKQMFEKAPARVVIGTGAGAAMGAPFAGIGAAPGGAMGATAGFAQAGGASSMALEMSGGILEALEKAGVNMGSPEELQKAFNDPERMQLAREFAQKKAIPVAAFDTVSSLLAGRLIGAKPATVLSKIGKGAVETAVQTFLGMGGEAAGQVAQSGEITSVRQVLAEAPGEAAIGTGEIAFGAASMAIQNRGKKLPTGGRVAFEEGVPTGTPPAPAAAPSGVQAPWQAAREQVAPTVTQVEVVGDDVFGEPTTAAVERPVVTGEERFAPPAAAAEQPAAAAGSTASVPMMITRQMEADLLARGFSQQDINRMTPLQANEILAGAGQRTAGPAVPTRETTDAGDGAATTEPRTDPVQNRTNPVQNRTNAGQTVTNRVETATNAVATAEPTVKPPKKLYRGEAQNQWDPNVRGMGTFALGKGRYSTTDKKFAGMYGEVKEVAPEEYWPRNPLVLPGTGDAAGLLATYIARNTNFRNIREFNAAYPDPGQFVREQGFDGIIAGNEVVKYVDEAPAPGAAGTAAASPFVLPRELSRSSPRYGMATISFSSDLDRAAYVLANDAIKPSKAAPKFRAAVEAAGLSVSEVVEHGKKVKAAIKQEAGGGAAPRSEVDIRLPEIPFATTQDTPAKRSRRRIKNMTAQSGAVDLSIVEDLVEYGRTIYRAGMDYATWAAAMTREFGARVGQFLRQAFDRIVSAYQASRFSDTTGAVGDVRPKAKPRQFEAKARGNEALAPETRARLGSEYIPISLNAQAEAAKEWINTNGLEAAKLRIAQLSGNDTTPTPLDFAIGIEASGRLSATGDHAGAAGIVSTMSQRATSLGQTISVLAMMARLTPEGIVLYGQNIVSRYINTLSPEAQERIKALQAEVDRLRTALADMKFKEGSEVIRSGKLGDEKIQDRIKRRVKARVQADLGPAAAGPEVTAETKARTQGLNRQVRDVLLSDAKQSEMIKQITQILTSQGNMPAAEAEAVGKSIVAAFTKIVTETRRNYVQGAKRGTKGLGKGNFDKLLKLLAEQKDMSDGEFLGQVSRLMGIPGMTAEMARELKALGQRYENATDQDVKMVIGAMMFEKAHELVPVEFWVKVRGFSYLAMLFAPKTWMRNLGGNQIQWIADVGRDAAVAGAVDPAMSMITGKRTSVGLNLGARLRGLMAPIEDVRKGYLWSKQQNPTFNFRQNFMAGVNHLRVLSKLTTQNRFEIADVRNVGGQIFSSKFMRFWEAGLSIALGAGDRAFWMSAFRASLAKMERAAIANGEWTGQPTPEMIEAAMAEAAYAIYQNPTVLGEAAKVVREGVNWGTTLGQTKQFGLGTGLLAFVQVPASIAMRGMVEWSPLGLINSFYKGMRGILYASSSGRIGAKFDQAAFNKAFTQALLGSGIYASGFWLYSIGVLTASQEDDDDFEAMRRASGTGAYRINLTALRRALLSGNWFTRQEGEQGDLIVPYDWAQPLAITVAAGAELAAQMERADRKQLKKGLADRAGMAAMSLVAGAKSLEELPLLSGLSSFIKSWGYGGPLQAITSTVAGMPSMFVPQIVRQAGQLNDNMVRETRGGDSAIQREFMKVLASIPGYSTKFPLRFDITGQAIQRYQYGGNSVLNVFFSPAMASEVKRNPVLQEVSRLINATGETEMVPKQVMRRTRINGAWVDLTNDQLAAYSYYLGNFTMSHFTWRMAAPVYARLPDEVKVKMLAQDITDIDAAVKSAVLGHDMRRLTRNQMFLRQALVNSPLGQSVPPK